MSNAMNETETDSSSENEPLLGDNKTVQKTKLYTAVYKKRWYILMVYSLLTFTQGGVWNSWGPISDTSKVAFGWDDSDIALLSAWGPITFVVSLVFFSWVLDEKGLRLACLITSVLVLAGTALRCITANPPASNWLIHTGQLLNGLGGPVAMAAPPVISARWFPVHERTTATAVANIFNSLGVAASFILGPLLICDPESYRQPMNLTQNNSTNVTEYTLDEINHMKNDIMLYMYYEFGLAGLLFLCILLYYPSTPKIPPSTTASIPRTYFKKGFTQLLRHRGFWVIGLTYGIAGGVFACWSSVLNLNLQAIDETQSTAGWIGFWATLGGVASGLTFGWFSDVFSGHMKLTIVILLFVATGSFTWFLLMVIKVIPVHIVPLYASVIIGGTCVLGTSPLFFELGCESAYPIAEGVTTGMLTQIFNIFGLVFLLVFKIPNIGTSWANWSLVASTVVCIPLMLTFPENYTRLKIDIGKVSE